jgi:phenylpropionate dioxygenase-like ring-hydroxylating dioxygenase large terminal subunit
MDKHRLTVPRDVTHTTALEDDLAAVQLPLLQASTLPPACYTSQAFYEREVERIFLKEWLCVGRVDQVPAPGDYFTLRLLGEPLVVVRDLQGEIQVLSVVCRHRGMAVVEGTGNRKSFQCPYHLWTYSLRGDLLGAPEMERTEQFAKSQCRLPALRVETWEGFIFVNFDDHAQPLGPRLAELSQRVHNYRLGEMRTAKTIVYEGEWNWKLMIENYMETYHVLGLHKGPHDLLPVHDPTTGAVNVRTEAYNGVYEVSWGRFTTPGTTFFSPGVVEARPGQLQWLPSPFPVLADLSAEERQRADFILVYPTHLFSPLPDGMFYGQVLPQGPSRITWSLSLCFPPATMERPDFAQHLQPAVDGLEFINSQDMWACRSVQEGLASRFAQPGRLSHLDQAIHQIARYVLSRVVGSEPTGI